MMYNHKRNESSPRIESAMHSGKHCYDTAISFKITY